MPIEPLNLGPFQAEQIKPVQAEDWLRIAITLLFSLALITFLGLYLYYAVHLEAAGTWSQTKEAFAVILPALTGTLGTVIGFYFGNRKSGG